MQRPLATSLAAILMALFAIASNSPLLAETTDEKLEVARVEYKTTVVTAREALILALEAEVRRVAETGNLDTTLSAKKELQDFRDAGKLPSSSRAKSAVTTYRSTVEKGRKKLIDLHKSAIVEYTKGLDLEKAQAIKQQIQELESPSSTGMVEDSSMPAGADTIPAIRQFLDAKRAAEAAATEQRERVGQVIDQRLEALESKSNASEASRIEALRSAKAKLEAEGVVPDLSEVQAVVRSTRPTVDAANKKADKAAERAIEVAKSRKSEELVAWLEAQRATLGITFIWAFEKDHVKYVHIEPNFSRAGYAPYIDEPPTRLLDAELKLKSGMVGWQNVKPNLIKFTFDHDVQPKFVRLHFLGSDVDPEMIVPKSIAVYDSLEPKTRRKLGGITNNVATSTWLEVPVSGRGRLFVVDIEKTSAWTMLAEVEFK
jgi:hypothetical protein